MLRARRSRTLPLVPVQIILMHFVNVVPDPPAGSHPIAWRLAFLSQVNKHPKFRFAPWVLGRPTGPSFTDRGLPGAACFPSCAYLDVDCAALICVAGNDVDLGHVQSEGHGISASLVQFCGDEVFTRSSHKLIVSTTCHMEHHLSAYRESAKRTFPSTHTYNSNNFISLSTNKRNLTLSSLKIRLHYSGIVTCRDPCEKPGKPQIMRLNACPENLTV